MAVDLIVYFSYIFPSVPLSPHLSKTNVKRLEEKSQLQAVVKWLFAEVEMTMLVFSDFLISFFVQN